MFVFRIFHTDGWCQFVTYATYVSAFLSAWIVVGFTVERYIVVYYPLQVSKASVSCDKK